MVETRAAVVRRWAIVLSGQERQRAAPLRAVRGVEALVVEDRLWLRGELVFADDSQLRQLIPGEQPFLVGPDGQLTRYGDLVPSAWLPDGPWQPLCSCLELQLPVIRNEISGRPVAARLTLVRDGAEVPATLLRTTLEVWAEFVESAPQWRLDDLAFVVDDQGNTIIRGTPLPPLPGAQWIERGGIATPAGWSWHPRVAPDVLVQHFDLTAGDLALLVPTTQLLAEDGDVEPVLSVVRADDWVRVTRSAVRRAAACRFAQGSQIP